MAIANMIESETKQYTALSEDELLAQLGARLESISSDMKQNDSFAVALPLPPVRDKAIVAGPMTDALKKVGLRFYRRFNRSLYGIVCDPNNADGKPIRDAAAHGADAVAIALAAFLTVHFAWLPAIAVIFASIVAKQFVKDSYVEGCKVWQEHLPQDK